MLYRTNRDYLLAAAFAFALTMLPAGAVFARGGGYGGGGGGMGGNSGASGGFGGQSGDHMFSKGIANTNGPDSSDRDYGRERAQDRMNGQGLAHNKAQNQANSRQDRTGTRYEKRQLH